MGALHEGHESLILESLGTCNHTIVSIFVNPTQFGPKEDFKDYPRNIDYDQGICEKHGVSAMFVPTETIIYPNGHEANYRPEKTLAESMCGKVVHIFFTVFAMWLSGYLTLFARLTHFLEIRIYNNG